MPHLEGLRVDRIFVQGQTVRVEVGSEASDARCPCCGGVSGRVHSRYQRRLSDRAVAGRPVLLHVTVRRFFCGNGDCASKTFAEQFPSLAGRYARSTRLLDDALRAVGLRICRGPGSPAQAYGQTGHAAFELLEFADVDDNDVIAPLPQYLGCFRSALRHEDGVVVQ